MCSSLSCSTARTHKLPTSNHRAHQMAHTNTQVAKKGKETSQEVQNKYGYSCVLIARNVLISISPHLFALYAQTRSISSLLPPLLLPRIHTPSHTHSSTVHSHSDGFNFSEFLRLLRGYVLDPFIRGMVRVLPSVCSLCSRCRILPVMCGVQEECSVWVWVCVCVF